MADGDLLSAAAVCCIIINKERHCAEKNVGVVVFRFIRYFKYAYAVSKETTHIILPLQSNSDAMALQRLFFSVGILITTIQY